MIIIIWVMDVPTPFMETLTDRLVSVDKLFHVLIGAAMVFFLTLDWQRRGKWKVATVSTMGIMVLAGVGLTSVTEFVQKLTPEVYRRWFDWYDIVAQGVGAVGMGVIYSFLQLLWVKPSKEEER